MGISKSDLYDADVYDAPELNSDGTAVYLTTTVVSTTAGTSTVVVNLPADGEGLLTSRDHPVAVGDYAVISGTLGGLGNGRFTVATVPSDTSFTTVEAIGTSTGGSVDFEYPPGLGNIGVDPTKQNVTPANLGQQAFTDLSNHELLDNEPVGTGVTYSNTSVGGKITQEKWANTATTFNIKTIDYTYTGPKVTTEVRKVFAAADGTTIIAQVTITYTYTGSTVTGVVTVRNV